MFQDEWIKIANMLKHCKNENPYIIVFHICIMSNMLFSFLIDHVKAILHTSAMKHGPYTNLLFLMTVKKLKVHNRNNSNNSLFIYSVFIFVFNPESIRPDWTAWNFKSAGNPALTLQFINFCRWKIVLQQLWMDSFEIVTAFEWWIIFFVAYLQHLASA